MRVGHGVCAVLLVLAAPAAAQKKPPKPEGVKLISTQKPEKGFIDDAFAFDGPGGRLALIRSDATSYAEVEVLDLDQGRSITKIDLTPVTTTPVKVIFVGDGQKLVVIARSGEKLAAVLVDLSGKVIKKWAAATDITVAEVDGADVLVIYDKKPTTKAVNHEIQIHRLDGGKGAVKKKKFVSDGDGFIKSMDMRILYWQDGYTRLVAQKKGTYDKFKDQRMNDSEAVFSVVDGALVKNTAMQDILAWTKLVKLRQAHPNERSFVHVTEDLKGVELVTADDKRIPVELAEPFHKYEPKSFAYEVKKTGKAYFTLTIDPVNPEALSKKVADPEIIDLYVLEPGTGKARRLARLPKLDRPFAWHAASGRWAVLRKHKGFDRGGSELEIYDLTAK